MSELNLRVVDCNGIDVVHELAGMKADWLLEVLQSNALLKCFILSLSITELDESSPLVWLLIDDLESISNVWL